MNPPRPIGPLFINWLSLKYTILISKIYLRTQKLLPVITAFPVLHSAVVSQRMSPTVFVLRLVSSSSIPIGIIWSLPSKIYQPHMIPLSPEQMMRYLLPSWWGLRGHNKNTGHVNLFIHMEIYSYKHEIQDGQKTFCMWPFHAKIVCNNSWNLSW